MSHDVEQAVPADCSLAYWKAVLAGLAPLDLPTDRPRSTIPACGEAEVSGRLSPELVARLRALADSADASMSMVLLAAFQALLSRWSRQADVIVGAASSEFAETESADRAGLVGTALPLRADLSDDPGLRVLLRRTKKAVLDGHQHRDVLIRQLAATVAPVPSPGQSPLFSVVLSYLGAAPSPAQEAPVITPPGRRPVVPEAASGTGDVRFDFDVFLREEIGGADGGVTVQVNYRPDLYDAATAERLLAHYVRLLEGAAESPQTSLSTLSLSSPAELAQQARWGSQPVPHQRSALIPELVAAHAQTQPERVAVLDGPCALTYGELDRGAERLASRLRAHGVGRDILVGVCLPRSAELVTALLAVLKAGGAYLPLDPEYPPDRLAFMLTDSGATVVVTNETVDTVLSADGVTVLRADHEPAGGAVAESGPFGAPEPGDLAYAIYTSGSTGSPKGVLVEHHSLLNLCSWHNRYYRVTPADRSTMLAAQSFDASIWELWPYLASGASIAVADPAVRTNPARLITWMKRVQVTMSFLPTPLAEAVLAEDDCMTLPLRALLTGGDTLHRRPQPGLPFILVNHYGPTECTVVATAAPVADTAAGTGAPSIGGPIDNAEVHLLDAQLRQVPLGVAGELYLGGEGVARGYLSRPELTRERFVTIPDAAPGTRWYRTGDLARWCNDGTLEFLGRVDRQLKIRGHRIEPGEIEARLMAHPQVAEALVVARSIAPGNSQLVGYMTVSGAVLPDLAEVRGWLGSRLPSVMVPAKLIVLAKLPLTPSGKVDRAALPDPGELTGAPKTAPRTDAERRLTSIWAEVFGRRTSEIGVEDNFLDLGGHSLLAAQVTRRIRQEFGTETPLACVFEAPTVAQLADLIELRLRESRPVQTAGPAGPTALAPPSGGVLPRRLGRTEAPLSHAQERLWFLHELHPDNPAYNVCHRIDWPTAVDHQVLTLALGDLAERHEVMRTRFIVAAGAPRQIIDPPSAIPVRLADLRAIPPGQVNAERDRIVAEEANTPFDLTSGPVLRATLVRLGDAEHTLILSQHHIVCDAWSVNLVLNELIGCYRARLGGHCPLPAEPALQYADFAVWQREWLNAGVLDKQLAYWRARLAGHPEPLELAADRPRVPGRSLRGATVRFVVPSTTRALVAGLARHHDATMFMTLLAAFQTLLHRYTGQPVVTVTTPVSNRSEPGLEAVAGMLLNTLVLRADFSGSPSFTELLTDTRGSVLDAFAHQDLPFERLVRELAPERDVAQLPFSPVMFAFSTLSSYQLDADTPLTVTEIHADATHNELVLVAEDGPAGLELCYEYDRNLFEPPTIERLHGHLVRLLTKVAAAPSLPVRDLTTIIPARRESRNGTAPTRKADRKALACLALPRDDVHDAPTGSTGPRDAVERAIAALFQELLGQAPVSVQDSFFDLGGHSLLVTLLVTRIRRDFMIDLPMRTIFDSPTVEALAAEVATRIMAR